MDNFFEEQLNDEQNINIGRYLKAFVNKWWLILLITAGISSPWYLYIKSQPPVYLATTLINFENVEGGMPENLLKSRILKLKSRTLMENVIAELGLTLVVEQNDNINIKREDIFKYFATKKNVKGGKYYFEFYPFGYCFLYHNGSLLDSLQINTLTDTLNYNGMMFLLNTDVQKKSERINFNISNFNATVRSLQSRLKIGSAGVGNILAISLKGRNPLIVSKTVNIIAENFSKKSIEMKREENNFVLDFLENQLKFAQEKLNQSDYQLESFRTKHIQGLNTETNETLKRLEQIDNQIAKLDFDSDMLNALLNKLDVENEEFDPSVSTNIIFRQIVNHPVLANNTEIMVVKKQLGDLDSEKMELLNSGRPELNPDVIEITTKISMLETKVLKIAEKKLEELEIEKKEMEKDREEQQRSLRSMPAEQLRAMKLSRQRNANEEIYRMILRQTKEAQIDRAVAGETVSIIDPAVPPVKPTKKDDMKKMIMGFMFAMVLGFGTVLVLEEIDKSIKTEDDISNYLNMSVLGVIPKVEFDENNLEDSEKAKSISSQIVTHDYSPTPVGEAYRSLRTNLLFSKTFGQVKSLVIASVSPGEGKSFTAANLAIALAQQKSNTLLIDADLRRGVLHNSFKCFKKPGLTNYLTGVNSLEDVLNETYVPNLSLITCGSMIPNPSELLGSSRMKKFLKELTERFNYILFDTCPLIAATDAVVLGSFTDGVVLMVRAGETNRNKVKTKIKLFHNVHANVIGTILNCAGVELAHEGYSYYRY